MILADIRRNANASIQCPVQPGDYVVDQTVELPAEIPKGEYGDGQARKQGGDGAS